jgi:hypothetical protein
VDSGVLRLVSDFLGRIDGLVCGFLWWHQLCRAQLS